MKPEIVVYTDECVTPETEPGLYYGIISTYIHALRLYKKASDVEYDTECNEWISYQNHILVYVFDNEIQYTDVFKTTKFLVEVRKRD